jgi:hypothetical protein
MTTPTKDPMALLQRIADENPRASRQTGVQKFHAGKI